MRKAQTSEILGLLMLVIFIVSAMLGLKLMKAGEKATTLDIATSAQNQQYFKSGANTFTILTEPKSNKTLLELIGICGYLEKNILTFGPPDNRYTVNVFDESEKRLDMLFGEGKWQLEIYHTPRYQMYIIMLIDSSRSMEDEILDIKNDIEKIIREVEDTTNKRVAYKLYFLSGGASYRAEFADIEKNNANLRTYNFDVSGENNNEAWATGMRNLINEYSGEWSYASARVGIILSDEPPRGCEGCPCNYYNNIETEACCPDLDACDNDESKCATKDQAISDLITTATDTSVNMKIYTLKANPCILPDYYDRPDYCHYTPKVPYSCAGNERLEEYMTTLSTGTDAEMYDVKNPDDVSAAIKEIVLKEPVPDVPFIIGSTPPEGKVIQSTNIPTPTPTPGIYTKIILKNWN